MREIKFRAWCKEENKMIIDYQDTIYIEYYGFNNDKFILMQFIGLHDKNNIPIYESDIVKLYPTEKEPFYGRTDIINWKDDEIVGWHLGPSYLVAWRNVSYEIIGNIYENPQLLQEK